MTIAAFDDAVFVARYPEFSQVSSATLKAYFQESGLYLNNTESSPVKDVSQRLMLINMIVAHLCQLYSGANGQPSSELVGRITSASMGSVSVSVDSMGAGSAAKSFWQQTKYGANFWQATSSYRTFKYMVRRCG